MEKIENYSYKGELKIRIRKLYNISEFIDIFLSILTFITIFLALLDVFLIGFCFFISSIILFFIKLYINGKIAELEEKFYFFK